jgi:hypothetical protein
MRGLLVTLASLIVFTPIVPRVVSMWGADARYSRAAVVAVVAAVSAGAIWKIFHSVPKARLLFVSGLLIGAILMVTE